MKYDTSIVELRNLLPAAKSVLIAVSTNSDIDKMAAALALFLVLEAQGKQVSIVSDDDVKVSSAYLFGVDHIQKTLPKTDGGNLTLTLEGVAASDNTIPALQKLDWYAQNNNLNLVFSVQPGQTFQPARIVPHYQGSGFNLIFTIGAANLNTLGNIYLQNQASFSGTHIVNIDNQQGNTNFGQSNVLDTNASSISEIMTNLISDLGFILDADTASNLLSGIFAATDNLTNAKSSAESYMAVAQCLRVGGRKPTVSATAPTIQPQPQAQPAFDWSALMSNAAQPQPVTSNPVVPVGDNSVNSFVNPTVATVNPATYADQGGDHGSSIDPMDAIMAAHMNGNTSLNSAPSPEERPSMEGLVSETVEPEWLTPKIFKGSSIG